MEVTSLHPEAAAKIPSFSVRGLFALLSPSEEILPVSASYSWLCCFMNFLFLISRCVLVPVSELLVSGVTVFWQSFWSTEAVKANFRIKQQCTGNEAFRGREETELTLVAPFSLLSPNSCTGCSLSTVMHKFYSLQSLLNVVFLGLWLCCGLAVLRVVQKWPKPLLFVLVKFFLTPLKF